MSKSEAMTPTERVIEAAKAAASWSWETFSIKECGHLAIPDMVELRNALDALSQAEHQGVRPLKQTTDPATGQPLFVHQEPPSPASDVCEQCEAAKQLAQAEWDAGGSPQSLPVKCPHQTFDLCECGHSEYLHRDEVCSHCICKIFRSQQKGR